jgi:intein/homing endonuclease
MSRKGNRGFKKHEIHTQRSGFSLDEVLHQEQEISVRKALALEQAFHSNDAVTIIKAQNYLKAQENNNRDAGIKSMLIDPMDVANSFGYKDKPYQLSYDMLRAMAKTHIIKAIIATRKAQVLNFCEPQKDKYSTGFIVDKKARWRASEKDKKLSIADQKKAEAITEFILNCGEPEFSWNADTFEKFTGKLLNDSLELDQGTFEIRRDKLQRPVEFFATDGATFRVAHAEEDTYEEENGYKPSVVQVYQGKVHAAFYPWEQCFGVRNPSTDIRTNGYGKAELEDMIQTVTSFLNADSYNANFFKVGSDPKGIIAYSGAINQNTIDSFRQQWQAQVSGVMNCIHGETKIITKDLGQVEIQNYFKNNDSDKDVEIWTGTGFEKGKVYKTDKKKVFTTRLNNGLRIKTSGEHKFRVVGEEGKLWWIERKDLKIGDHVLVNKKVVDGNLSLQYNGLEVEEDLMEVLGWALGDGCFYTGESKRKKLTLFYHSKKEQYILNNHLDILKKYGVNCYYNEQVYTVEQKEALIKRNGFKTVADKCTSINVFDSKFYDFLKEFGFKSSKDGKIIPSSVYKLGSRLKCALLRGLFSADGCNVAKRTVQLSIAHERLRDDVRLLLLSEGIRTSAFEGSNGISFKGFETFKGMLLVKDRDIYFDKIGFIQDYKDKNIGIKSSYGSMKSLSPGLRKHYALQVRKYNNEQKILTFRERCNLNSIIAGADECSIERMIKYMNIVNYPIPEWMNKYYSEPIIELIETDDIVQMYDVEVFNDEHQFLGNGMSLHNSHKTPIINADKINWIPTHVPNKDMEFAKFQEFLIKIGCAIFIIDPSEIGFPMDGASDGNKGLGGGNNSEKLKYSKDKGLKPLLKNLQYWLNKYVVSQIDPEFEFRFVGIDDDEDKTTELDEDIKKVGGFMTVNEIRAKYNLDPIEGMDIILNPVAFQATQTAMMGNQESNDVVDQMQGGGKDENPFIKSLNADLGRILAS